MRDKINQDIAGPVQSIAESGMVKMLDQRLKITGEYMGSAVEETRIYEEGSGKEGIGEMEEFEEGSRN